MGVYESSLLIYQTFLYPVIVISIIFYALAMAGVLSKPRKTKFKGGVKEWPSVSIQIPVYNDPVAARCIEHCLNMDYPKGKFDIMVADDSTDNTRKLLEGYAKRFPGRVKVFRRGTRSGFKAGALNAILPRTKGDIVVIFDSDFTPDRAFLKRILRPLMEDDSVAFVQSRMGYINHDQNMVTRVATTFLMIYHQLIVPINNSINSAFFGGTGGAIRKSVILKLGGWNEKSLVEDADLSFRIIKAGYKSVYLSDVVVKGELPFTMLSFIRQQMRWTYGMARIFVENASSIIFQRGFSLPQRVMITYITIGSLIAPFVAVMTISGMVSISTGTPRPISLEDVTGYIRTFAISGGFMAAAFIALWRENKLPLFKSVFLGTLTVGVLITMTNSIAMAEALLGYRMTWFRTPKFGSLRIVEIFKELFRGVFR